MRTEIVLAEKQKKVETLSASKHEEPVKLVSAQSFYFDRKPYVHPFIVRDRTTWLSDLSKKLRVVFMPCGQLAMVEQWGILRIFSL